MIQMPEERAAAKVAHDFPTDWQAVIFRNYGMIGEGRIAAAIGATEETVRREAQRLGLEKIVYRPVWREKGYITVIRNNWNLLSYRQLLLLLDATPEWLAFTLKEDDFLDVKLGDFKPVVAEPVYAPLTEEQARATEKIAAVVRKNRIAPEAEPFGFEFPAAGAPRANGVFSDTIIYSYYALYGDAFMGDVSENFSDELLGAYAARGINGIWMQGVLSCLSAYPFDPSSGDDYLVRRKNLSALIEKCARYGIRIFLYFNEPRALPGEAFVGREGQMGERLGDYFALCTSAEETKRYLYDAVKDLFSACPDLGGLITITMSENLTHCCSKKLPGEVQCPRCAARGAEEVSAEINNIMMRAVRDSGSSAKVIANLWGWDGFMGWDTARTKRGIDLLDGDVEVMLISENSKEVQKGGVKSSVIDYSISNVGPSARSRELLEYAKKRGHRIFAKVQINNSWEMSAAPYLPVFDLIREHAENLEKIGVDGLMLSWTLGGYPGGGLDYLAALCCGEGEAWYGEAFGENAGRARRAVAIFSEAFREFPFCLDTLYRGPQNTGSSLLWFEKPTGRKSTMVGYPYDDLDGWRGVYGADVWTAQMGKVSEGWKRGLEILREAEGNAQYARLRRVAEVCYAHFYSSFLAAEFVEKREKPECRAEVAALLSEEYRNARALYAAQCEDASIGFEASNQYYYNENAFLEKFVNLEALAARFGGSDD